MSTSEGLSGLRVLAVDDEAPALDDLLWNLKQLDGIGTMHSARSARDALDLLAAHEFDVALLDIEMANVEGNMDGLNLGRYVNTMLAPPAIVFVTAYERHAVDAFELRATDYVLKPIRLERLRSAIERVRQAREMRLSASGLAPGPGTEAGESSDVGGRKRLAVESVGRTIFVDRDDVLAVEASRDYVRLHTSSEKSYLVRMPISTLETEWESAGFVRVHRSFLVALKRVTELRTDVSQGSSVRVGNMQIPVSRTYVRIVREHLLGGNT